MSRRTVRSITILALLGVLTFVVNARAASGRIVYTGADPASGSHHPDEAQAVVLARNAVQWVGGSADPIIGYAAGESAPGGVLAILTDAGFTNLTALTAGDLAVANLSVYDALYIGVVVDGFNYADAEANVQSYVDAGGGLVAEPELIQAGAWDWLPFADLIGHSGKANVHNDNVTIVNPGHPVMAGLTDAGLSDWVASIHSTFASPEAAGFARLTNDADSGLAHIIAIPEPGALSLLTFGGLMLSRRRWR